MFDEKRSWITKYMPFSVFLLIIRYKWKNYISVKQTVFDFQPQGRYFNFRGICNRNLWDMGYLVKKLQGYGIFRPPAPNGASMMSSTLFSFVLSSSSFRRRANAWDVSGQKYDVSTFSDVIIK